MTYWENSSGVRRVSGVRWDVAHCTNWLPADEPLKAALTAAASNDASYALSNLTRNSGSIGTGMGLRAERHSSSSKQNPASTSRVVVICGVLVFLLTLQRIPFCCFWALTPLTPLQCGLCTTALDTPRFGEGFRSNISSSWPVMGVPQISDLISTTAQLMPYASCLPFHLLRP